MPHVYCGKKVGSSTGKPSISRRQPELHFVGTDRVVQLEESAVLPERIGVRDCNVEPLRDVARPPAPAVLHEVAPHLHTRTEVNYACCGET